MQDYFNVGFIGGKSLITPHIDHYSYTINSIENTYIKNWMWSYNSKKLFFISILLVDIQDTSQDKHFVQHYNYP